MRHVVSALVHNVPGVLSHISGMLASRGYNIDSLNVAPTLDESVSHITLVTHGDDETIEQITKQLHKLVNVIKIQDLTPAESIDRELVLFKVNAPPDRRHEVIEVANVFRAKIVDVGKNSLTIEATGTADKLQAMEDLLRAYGIKELARTGKIALARGSKES